MELETTEVATEQAQPEVSNEVMEQETVNQEPTQAEQEMLDWTQDKRAKTMWKNDANQLYGSYRNMEKMYTPLKSQIDQLNSVFKEYGVDTNRIGDVLKEYKTYTDPNAPQNQWLNYLSKHLNAEHKDKVVEFFNNLDQETDRKKYGENLPQEVIEKLKLAEQLEQRLNAKEQAEQEKAQYQQTVSTIESKLGEVEQLAKDYDVVYDEATKEGLLKYCMENNIEPQYIPHVFARLAMDAVKKSASVKSERAVVGNLQSNKKAGITTKTVGVTQKSDKRDFRSDMSKRLFGE